MIRAAAGTFCDLTKAAASLIKGLQPLKCFVRITAPNAPVRAHIDKGTKHTRHCLTLAILSYKICIPVVLCFLKHVCIAKVRRLSTKILMAVRIFKACDRTNASCEPAQLAATTSAFQSQSASFEGVRVENLVVKLKRSASGVRDLTDNARQR